MFTVKTVKAELPKVKVLVAKGKTRKTDKIIEGNICGRLNQFATVWTKDNHEGWEFSWETIVDAINNDRPLRVI